MRQKGIAIAAASALAMIVATGARAGAQRGRGGPAGPPPPARTSAPVDLTGYWVSVVTEDWRFRMVTPPKGDYVNIPLNAEGRRIADTWDPSKDGSCEAYGAASVMRMPGRVHITWQDDNTLKIETDAGQQTRLLHFGVTRPQSGERSLQGYSVAQWVGGGPGFGGLGGFGGFGGNVAAPGTGQGQGGPQAAVTPPARGGAPAGGTAAPAPAGAPPPASAPAAPPGRAAVPGAAAAGGAGRGAGAPERWGVLRAVTTLLRGGWLQKNGPPYSENATVTENFMRFPDGNDLWFTVSTIVDDPTYLNQTFITSTNFKREPDGSKWHPVACRAS